MTNKDFLRKVSKLGDKEKIGAIVSVEGEEKLALAYFKANQTSVKHTYKLIKAFSVEAAPSKLLELAKQKWVKKIEEDKELKAV